jgi:hypothetical protein
MSWTSRAAHPETLTSILQKMDRRSSCPPTSDRKHRQVPAFLRHLATLFTCGASDNPDAKRVIAVTGTLDAEELRTLIVTQNPFGSSDVSEFKVRQITISHILDDSFHQVNIGSFNIDNSLFSV